MIKRTKEIQRKYSCPVHKQAAYFHDVPRCVLSCYYFFFVDVCSTLLGCHSNPEASLCDPLRRVSCFSLLVLQFELAQLRSKSFHCRPKTFCLLWSVFSRILCYFRLFLSLAMLFCCLSSFVKFCLIQL